MLDNLESYASKNFRNKKAKSFFAGTLWSFVHFFMQVCYFCTEKHVSKSMRRFAKRSKIVNVFFSIFCHHYRFCCSDFSKLYFCYVYFLELSTQNGIPKTMSGRCFKEKCAWSKFVRSILSFVSFKICASEEKVTKIQIVLFFFAEFSTVRENLLQGLSRVCSFHHLPFPRNATRVLRSSFRPNQFFATQIFWAQKVWFSGMWDS